MWLSIYKLIRFSNVIIVTLHPPNGRRRNSRPTKSHALGVRRTHLGSVSRSHAQQPFSHALGPDREKIKINDNVLPNRTRVYKKRNLQ